MAVKLRLARQGAKKNPQYLIIAANSTAKRDGAFLEKLGHYFPKAAKPADKVKVNLEAVKAWLAKGAEPTKTVSELLKNVSA
jgi:small subunit ribosomal protein S16